VDYKGATNAADQRLDPPQAVATRYECASAPECQACAVFKSDGPPKRLDKTTRLANPDCHPRARAAFGGGQLALMIVPVETIGVEPSGEPFL